MFSSAFYKNTRLVLLLAALFLTQNFLSAQSPNSHFLEQSKKKHTKIPTSSETYALLEYKPTPVVDTLKTEIDSARINILAAVDSVKTQKDTTKAQPLVVETASDNRVFEDSVCIDLAFDSVSVIQITEKYIELEYTISNKGTAPAPIFGTKKTFKDNVAVHFFFSGTPRLNRGSILAEAMYLTEGLKPTKGILAPKESYKNRIKLPLEKRSRFYGVIILQLDAFDILRRECDETNNTYSIVPRWY